MSADEIKEETTAETPAASSSEAKEASAKRPSKKPIVIGVIVVVLIAAVAGFWVWHEQPSFCNAICHTPMDAINEQYAQEPGVAGFDKYKNEVANTNGMAAVSHQAGDLNVTCLECHVPQISEQIGEGIMWVGGDYDVVVNKDGQMLPTEKTLEDLVVARGLQPEQFCLSSGCHANEDGSAMTIEDLKEATSDLAHNPHDFQHGDVACSDCHKAHRASINTCSECHANAEIPEGWLTYSEAQNLDIPVAVETEEAAA